MANEKSDIDAVEQCRTWLQKEGYKDVKIAHKPTDIACTKDGRKVYVEVKMTGQKAYFGAATLTEWIQVFNEDADLLFVVAKEIVNQNDKGGINNESEKKKGKKYEFFYAEPQEFYNFSTIPPFKIYFNVTQKEFKEAEESRILTFDKRRVNRRKPDTIILNEEKLKLLGYMHGILREEALIEKMLQIIENPDNGLIK